ncbi:pyrroloquinoline-quinone synthase [Oxalobacteraceae bacterium GrIS 1.11]
MLHATQNITTNPTLVRTPPSLNAITKEFADRLLAHPFLVRCAEGTITRRELDNFLIQQGKYSQYFTRYLCALISNLEDGRDVQRLAENLSEELGYGDDSRTPHSHIYAAMIADLGLNGEHASTLLETQALIDSMFMLCRQPGGVPGLAAMCLGAEAIVPSLYSCILKGFVSQGIDVARLNFFTIHIECDDEHAQTMFDMLAERIAQSSSNYVSALQAGEIAINARLRMLDALIQEVN